MARYRRLQRIRRRRQCDNTLETPSTQQKCPTSESSLKPNVIHPPAQQPCHHARQQQPAPLPPAYRQSNNPAHSATVLPKPSQTLSLCHRLQLRVSHVHAGKQTSYAYLTAKTRTAHPEPQTYRLLAPRQTQLLKRNGDTHVQKCLRCLFLNMVVLHRSRCLSIQPHHQCCKACYRRPESSPQPQPSPSTHCPSSGRRQCMPR